MQNDCAPVLWQARGLVLAAAVLWSTSGFFVKSPSLDGWGGGVLAFWRAVFACVVLWPMVRQPRWTWQLLPMTALFAAMNYTYLTAMAQGTAANAIWLQCTAPVWVLFIGVLIFGERATRRDWILTAFVATGVGIMLYFESRGAAVEAVGWGLVSGLCYAGVVLALRQLRTLDPVWMAALNHLVTAIVLAPFAVSHAALPHGIQWLLLACFGIFQMGVPYVLFARGLRHIPGHEATGIALIEPLLVPMWAYLAWGERPAWWTVIGAVFILTGLVIRYVEPAKKRS
jgi:drug/metabolite transporter (DMT)-like permease